MHFFFIFIQHVDKIHEQKFKKKSHDPKNICMHCIFFYVLLVLLFYLTNNIFFMKYRIKNPIHQHNGNAFFIYMFCMLQQRFRLRNIYFHFFLFKILNFCSLFALLSFILSLWHVYGYDGSILLWVVCFMKINLVKWKLLYSIYMYVYVHNSKVENCTV